MNLSPASRTGFLPRPDLLPAGPASVQRVAGPRRFVFLRLRLSLRLLVLLFLFAHALHHLPAVKHIHFVRILQVSDFTHNDHLAQFIKYGKISGTTSNNGGLTSDLDYDKVLIVYSFASDTGRAVPFRSATDKISFMVFSTSGGNINLSANVARTVYYAYIEIDSLPSEWQ